MAHPILAVWLCPFCDVGGTMTRNFMLVVFGAVLLGYFCFLLWAIFSGQFKDVEHPKFRILELDRSTGVRLDKR